MVTNIPSRKYISPHTSSKKIIDRHGRLISYLRLAVTDRCNLNCSYCRPKGNLVFHKKNTESSMTTSEIVRLVRIFSDLGITKIRLTGGEPFMRQNFLDTWSQISKCAGSTELHITTNGILAGPYLGRLKNQGLSGINLSMDTLRKERFQTITGNNRFEDNQRIFKRIIRHGIPLKINTVLLDGLNTDEIHSISQLARVHPIEIRFIEKMAFNGKSDDARTQLTAGDVLRILRQMYPGLTRVKRMHSTASVYRIPSFRGKIGIIGGHSRLFCNECNRIRVTSSGWLKTCLYDGGVLNLKDMLRTGESNRGIVNAILDAVVNRPKNGFEAERKRIDPEIRCSMAMIGG